MCKQWKPTSDLTGCCALKHSGVRLWQRHSEQTPDGLSVPHLTGSSSGYLSWVNMVKLTGSVRSNMAAYSSRSGTQCGGYLNRAVSCRSMDRCITNLQQSKVVAKRAAMASSVTGVCTMPWPAWSTELENVRGCNRNVVTLKCSCWVDEPRWMLIMTCTTWTRLLTGQGFGICKLSDPPV